MSNLPQHKKNKLDRCLSATTNVIYCRAPGRINLIGEHTDYNNGLVLPAAIDKYMYFAILPNDSRTIKATAIDVEQSLSIDLDNLDKTRYDWADYLVGILIQFRKRGVALEGFECAFTSDIPIGAGLSSSSALECAFMVGIQELYKTSYDNWELINISQSSNHSFLGIKGGILDQFASLFGKEDHLMLLDCATNDFGYTRMPPSSLSILLINTCVRHNHLTSGYNDRVSECQQALLDIKKALPVIQHLSEISKVEEIAAVSFSSVVIASRAKYIIEENARVRKFVDSMLNVDFLTCGQLLYASHEGLSQDYVVSCKELDYLVALLRSDSAVLGSRMMGGGFGGCTINLVKKTSIVEVSAKVIDAYYREFGLSPELITVNIGQGAGIIN